MRFLVYDRDAKFPPMRVSPAQERTLLARLEAARQVYNACLGQARVRARLVRESKAFQRARTLSREDPERKRLFAQARTKHAFSDYALQADAKPLGHSWVGEQQDQPRDRRSWPRGPLALPTGCSWGKPNECGACGKAQLDSVEGKVNTSGIRWCGDRVEWLGLVLPARLDARDLVVAHGLACPVKYVRLVRRKLGLRHRISAQLVCAGTPYRKAQHSLGQGIVGLGSLTKRYRRGREMRRRCSGRSAPR